MSAEQPKTFREAGETKPLSLGEEILQMLKHNKKYWMIPLLLFIVLFGLILILGQPGSPIAPFIYTLF